MRSSATPRRGRGERGETLIETMITVVLLAMLAVGVIASLGTNILVSDNDARLAGSEAVLRSYAQAWQRAPYLPCTSSANPYGTAAPDGFTAPTRYTATLVSPVKVWNSGSGASSPATFTACPATDTGLQTLDLKVSSDRGTEQTLTIQKRKP
jgi:type II secretory pathway pseudopilin PulG